MKASGGDGSPAESRALRGNCSGDLGKNKAQARNNPGEWRSWVRRTGSCVCVLGHRRPMCRYETYLKAPEALKKVQNKDMIFVF